ncbi:MAG TPA: hypothetical protein PLL32_03465 [Anaeromyxobacteraceae bacterium]|nr:hypothetical protein [Anaeromyxobacteraceae bacterium]
MGTLGLISFLFALVAIPIRTSRMADPRKGIRVMMVGLLAASVLYAAFAAYVYSPYFPPEDW